MSRTVVIVPTGTANLASVQAAFRRQDWDTQMATDAASIGNASHVMLPGVGSFGAAMANLVSAGLAEPMAERLRAERPTMAICVGLQLLFEGSDESPGAWGLGVIPGHVGRFEGDVRVPQFGWNRLEGEGTVVRPGYAYFANSFRALAAPGWTVATAEHGGTFVAAIERGPVVGCQFHPELSSGYGRDLLARWLQC